MLPRCFLVALALPVALGCIGDIGPGEDGPDGSGAGTNAPKALEPAAPTLHRLTNPQLANAWTDLLGEPLVVPTELPNDDAAYGFTSIAAARTTISSVEAEQLEKATYQVLDQVFVDPARRDAFVGCTFATVSDPCVRPFVEAFTSRAWRRPATSTEIDAIMAVGTQIEADLESATTGLEFALAVVLQAPDFLFRVELGEPDIDHPGLFRYTSWEMASRLSFLLLDGPPDDELWAAADAGDLQDVDVVRQHAERLLADTRSRPPLVRFFRDFMQVGNLDKLDKDTLKFPMFSDTLGPAMRVEIERMFENVVFEKEGDFRQLFTTRETYLNEELAAVYGIEGITGSEWRPYVFAEDSHRGGLLTSAAFLAMNAHKTQTSPTHRGRFVQINLLCNDIPPPPAGVDTTVPEANPSEPTTLRTRLDKHRDNPSCSGCHSRMDPIGFAFEHFDAIGAYRDVDELGLPVDSVTEVEGEPVPGGVELGQLVAQLPEVGACVARRFYEHAGGHLAGDGDELSVEKLVSSFVASDYDFKELVVALVTNDGYRYATPGLEEEGLEEQEEGGSQ